MTIKSISSSGKSNSPGGVIIVCIIYDHWWFIREERAPASSSEGAGKNPFQFFRRLLSILVLDKILMELCLWNTNTQCLQFMTFKRFLRHCECHQFKISITAKSISRWKRVMDKIFWRNVGQNPAKEQFAIPSASQIAQVQNMQR